MATELLKDQRFLQPPEIAAQLTIGNDKNFQFASAETEGHGRNATVHGRLFFTTGPWATRPFVTLVHGWNAELHYLYILPRVARALNQAGMNAALIELPYHLHRRPLEKNGMRDFIADNLVGMLFATRQAISDIHTLNLWAQRQGCPRVGVWGFSLGAWLAGLYICETELASAAVLTTPVANLERAVEELSFCHPIRAGMEGCKIELSALNLSYRRPRVAAENIQVVESLYDLFVPSKTYSELANAWGLSGWEKETQGHISILISRGAMLRSIRWLENRLRS